MPKYIKESPQSFFALSPEGKEIPCGEIEGYTIREMQIADVPKCFKTPNIKKLVKVFKNFFGWKDKDARAKIEADFRNRIRNHPEEEFAINYVIEYKGNFIGYAEVENFGIEHGKKKTFVRITKKGGEQVSESVDFDDEPTYAGVELFLVDSENGNLMQEVLKAFGNLCVKYGFYDHLEWIQTVRTKNDEDDVETVKIILRGTIYDWEIAKVTQEVTNVLQEAI